MFNVALIRGCDKVHCKGPILDLIVESSFDIVCHLAVVDDGKDALMLWWDGIGWDH